MIWIGARRSKFIEKVSCCPTKGRPLPAGNALMWTKISGPPWVASMKPNPRSSFQDLRVPVKCMRKGELRSLTFELSGRRRQDARPGLARMYRVPSARAWWPVVGPRLDRVVRPHWARFALMATFSATSVSFPMRKASLNSDKASSRRLRESLPELLRTWSS